MDDDGIDDEVRDLPLASLIEAIHTELAVAQELARQRGRESPLAVTSMEVEVNVEVRRDKEAKGEVKFWVLTGGGGVKKGDKRTHRVKLCLTPTGSMLVSGVDFSSNALPESYEP